MTKVDLLYFDAGGGHRSAANALKESVERQNKPWRVELVNLQEQLDELDIFRKLFGLRLQDCSLYSFGLYRGRDHDVPRRTRGLAARRTHGMIATVQLTSTRSTH